MSKMCSIGPKHEDKSESPWAASTSCMIMLSLIYLPIMYMIYSNRHTQAVSFKSPLLILIGGTALYIDAMCNILLLNKL